jgi:protein required for attachment to host cells
MILPQGTLIALVDGENFELYRNIGLATDPKLESVKTPNLESTNYSAGARNKDKISRFTAGAPKDKVDRLEESAHAAAVVAWLNSQAINNHLDKVVIIADPRSLGEMRRHYHKKLEDVLLGDLDRTLTGRSGPEILKALDAV